MMVEQDGRRQWVSGAPQEATKENVRAIVLPRDNPGARRQARWDQGPQVSDGAMLLKARGTSNSCASADRVRARETERVLRKLDLSREQAEAVECLSRSLVEKLVRGPIAKVTAIMERTGASAGGREA
jgi:Glutamyl-tRNAGlu reductase, dimerisation domain